MVRMYVYNYSCNKVKILTSAFYNYDTDIRADIGGRHQRHNFEEMASRRHFVTRQDCHNACRKVRDFRNHRHVNDAVSVDRIVRELKLEKPCPVIAYKPLGSKDKKYPSLKDENFLLVLMTAFQANLFKKFSTFACVDSTHKTNEYGYKLISLLVVDEFRKGTVSIRNMYIIISQKCNKKLLIMTGQPVAWAITDTEEINCYEEFFKAIKATVPDATINTLMTDDGMIMHATTYHIDNCTLFI